jgi:hypothetical protein
MTLAKPVWSVDFQVYEKYSAAANQIVSAKYRKEIGKLS